MGERFYLNENIQLNRKGKTHRILAVYRFYEYILFERHI